MTSPAKLSYRRVLARDQREIRRTLAAPAVAAAVGPITPGCEIFGVSRGDWSLVDLIEHVLSATGPARVVLSTWTAAGADIGFAYALLSSGEILDLRFVVDFSFPVRQPAYCAALRERFGDDAIRVTKNHCKFVVIENDAWHVVIRSSMNLNENRRWESFEVSDDAGMAGYLRGLVDELFAAHAPGSQFTKRPIENCQDFEAFGVGGAAADEAVAVEADRGKYFGEGPFANDLRRTGLSYIRERG